MQPFFLTKQVANRHDLCAFLHIRNLNAEFRPYVQHTSLVKLLIGLPMLLEVPESSFVLVLDPQVLQDNVPLQNEVRFRENCAAIKWLILCKIVGANHTARPNWAAFMESKNESENPGRTASKSRMTCVCLAMSLTLTEVLNFSSLSIIRECVTCHISYRVNFNNPKTRNRLNPSGFPPNRTHFLFGSWRHTRMSTSMVAFSSSS